MKISWVLILFSFAIVCHSQIGRNNWRLDWWWNGIRGTPPINSYEHLGINPMQIYAQNPYLNRLTRRAEYLKRLLYGSSYTPYHRLPGRRNNQGVYNMRHPPFTSVNLPHCEGLFANGTTSNGLYNITVNGRTFPVFCEFIANEGSWLVIQRRTGASTNFQQNFSMYESGFGPSDQDFWIGLANLYDILKTSSHKLRVDIEDFNGVRAFAEYQEFDIAGIGDDYRLFVNGYRGSARDALRYHNGYPFSTVDRDRDSHYQGGNCAQLHGGGGWWYNDCLLANLNGQYIMGGVNNITGIVWHTWRNSHYSLQNATMKIRPVLSGQYK